MKFRFVRLVILGAAIALVVAALVHFVPGPSSRTLAVPADVNPTATQPAQATAPAPTAEVTPVPATSSPATPATPAGTPSTASVNGPISCEPAAPDDYATCRFTEASGDSMTFYLFRPLNYDPRRSYPLVLLLHGGGERASPTKTAQENRVTLLSNPAIAVWGPGVNLPDSPEVQQRWPSFIVVPQVEFPDRYVAVDPSVGSYTLQPQPSKWLRISKEIVDTLRQQYASIDSDRLYVTGLSMGGYGTWEMIERWPDEFAAAAPICGAGDPSLAGRLVNLPIWAFHGALDPIVPVAGSRDMIQAIRAAGGNPRYTEYPDVGHGSWEYPYDITGKPSPTPDFYDWLFAQRKGQPSP